MFYIVRTLHFYHKIYKKLSSSIFKKLRTSLKIVYFLKRGLVITSNDKKCSPWWALTNKKRNLKNAWAVPEIYAFLLSGRPSWIFSKSRHLPYLLVFCRLLIYQNDQQIKPYNFCLRCYDLKWLLKMTNIWCTPNSFLSISLFTVGAM